MLNRIILATAFVLLSFVAHAQNVNLNCLTSTTTPFWQPVSISNPCPVGSDSGTSPVQSQTIGGTRTAGQAVGNLWSFPIARLAGGSGIATNFMWISAGGDTTGKILRLWDVKPVNTTCTDGSAFVSSATDDQHLLFAPWNGAFTPSAPSNTTGDSKTYGNLTALTLDFRNQDATNTQNVYGCVITTASDSADSGVKVYVNLMGPQN